MIYGLLIALVTTVFFKARQQSSMESANSLLKPTHEAGARSSRAMKRGKKMTKTGFHMQSTPLLSWLYLLNAAVLITHEIDSAYWREWELFRIPGGIQVFLGLNLLLVTVILYGHQALALGRASGFVLSWALVAGGFFAAIVHAFFLLQGNHAFLAPASLALLFATFVLSLAQAVALIRARSAST